MRRAVVLGDVGGFGADYHVGDEAMFEACVDLLRAAGWEVVAVSRHPDRTSRDLAVHAVPRLPFHDCVDEAEREALLAKVLSASTSSPQVSWPALDALHGAEALVVCGGGNLNASFPALFYERIALLAAAQRLGLVRLVSGQTLGPHLRTREFELLAQGLAGARLVGVREPASSVLAQRLGESISTELAVHAQLDDAAFLDGERPEVVPGWIEEEWIGITLAGRELPLGELAAELDHLVRRTSARLVFLGHAGDPQSDWVVAEQLAARLRCPLEVVPLCTARQTVWWTARAAMVISSRYHPLVFGLAADVPCLGLYEDDYTRLKARGALSWWGLGPWSMPTEMSPAALCLAAGETWERRAEIRSHLQRCNPLLRARWEAGRRLLAAAAEPGGTPPRVDPAWADVNAEPTPPRPAGWWSGLATRIAERADRLQGEVWGHQATALAAFRYVSNLREYLERKDAELTVLQDKLAEQRTG